jgi:glycosyltransferase involved in cell wall biosynthesis
MPLITVGIPVFNAMPYLPESLESILGQSYGDFEILAINDGSTDESLEYLRSVRDRRLRVINQENRGLTATLNRMLAQASTPWLARHDADDVAYPNRIALTVDYINQYPAAGMFYSLADYYPNGSVGQFRTTRGTPSTIRQLVLSGRLPAICHPAVTLNVIKTAGAGGYRFNLHVEDIDLWWRLALREDLRLIPEVTTGVRLNLGSVSSANLENQEVNTLYIQYLLLSHLWKRTPLSYTEARVALMYLLDARRLNFRAHIRAFNVALGQRKRSTALYELGRAWIASPFDFMRRASDEWIEKRTISLGESPELFARLEKLLWPSERTPSESNTFGSEPTLTGHARL